MKIRKKFLCLMLALCMVFTMTPTMAMAEGTVTEVSDAAGFATITDGTTYKLTADITMDGTITIPAGVTATIDLNGHVLQGNGSNALITNNGTLTIEDSNPTNPHYGRLVDVTHTFTPSGSSEVTMLYEDALWVWDPDATAETEGCIEITGGIITGQDNGSGGTDVSRGIRNNGSGATLYLNGGTFAGNITGKADGAAVYNNNGTVYINKTKMIYNLTTEYIGGGFGTVDGTVVVGEAGCTDSSCSDVYIKNNRAYYSGQDISLKSSGSDFGLYVTFNCGQFGRAKVEAFASEASLTNITINGGTFEWMWLAHDKIVANANGGKVDELQSDGADINVGEDADVTQLPRESTIDLNSGAYNIKEMPITLSNKTNLQNSKTFTVISPAGLKPFIAANAQEGDTTYSLVWNLNEDDGQYYTSLIVPGGETAILSYEKYAPAATYKQISGKAQTQNNDPLLVIGTVTGDEALRPEGRLYYLFSGSLTSEKLAEFEGNTAAMQAYGQGLTRVMDSSAEFNAATAAGSSAATTYNGYSELQAADITIEKGDADLTEIPQALKDVPVRISLGQDVVRYYTDASFETETTEGEAAYRVDYTYEYTTLADNNGAAITLGELLSGPLNYAMSYSDVAVYTPSGNDWVPAAGTYNTSNVSGLDEEITYEGDFSDIEDEILGYINDDDASNDFWNQEGSSFGLYVTYEYISANVCLSTYVPAADTGYAQAYSAASLLAPDASPADFTYKVYKKASGSGDWTEVTADAGDYIVEYKDSILITATDAAVYEGAAGYSVAVQNNAFAFADDTYAGATAAFSLTPSAGQNEAGFDGLVTIRRAYDGTYAQVDKQINLVIKPKVDAAAPAITVPAALVYVTDESGDVTASLAPDVIVTDGGALTYQWYEGDSELNGETGSSLDISKSGVDAQTSVTYKLAATNTNEDASINGDTTTTSEATVEVTYIPYTAGGNIPAGSTVYSGTTTIVLPEEMAGSVADGNITFPGGSVITNAGSDAAVSGAVTSVTVPLGSLAQVVSGDNGSVVLPAGSTVVKESGTYSLPNGGRITALGTVQPNATVFDPVLSVVIADTDYNAGDTITADIQVTATADVNITSFNFGLTYDAAALTLESIAKSGAVGGNLVVNTSTGRATYADVENPVALTKDTAVTLATATFKVKTDVTDEAAVSIGLTSMSMAEAGGSTQVTPAANADNVTLHNKTVTLVPGSGATVNGSAGNLVLYAKYGAAGLYSDAARTAGVDSITVAPLAGYRLAAGTDAEPLWINAADDSETYKDFSAVAAAMIEESKTLNLQAVEVVDIAFAIGDNITWTAGSAPEAKQIDKGTTFGDLELPEITVAANYTLSGWFVEDTLMTDDYEFTEGVTIKAIAVPSAFDFTTNLDTVTQAELTDITGVTDDKATYGTDITFKAGIKSANTGDYVLTGVSYKVGTATEGTILTPDGSGVYTIPGDQITGAVSVTVEVTEYHKITFSSGENASFAGGDDSDKVYYVVNGQAGYYEDPAHIGDSNNAVTIDLTVEAADGYRLADENLLWSDGTSSYSAAALAAQPFEADAELTAQTVKTYVVTFTSDANGSITGAATITVDTGTLWSAVTKSEYAAATGYQFDKWTAGDGTDAIADDYAVTSDITVKANFVPKTFTVTVPVTTNPVFAVSGAEPADDVATSGNYTATYGTDVTITMTASQGIKVTEITGTIEGQTGDTQQSDTGITSWTWEIAGNDILGNIAVTYTANATYTITVIAGENGTVTPAAITYDKDDKIAESDFTITPDAGYVIDTNELAEANIIGTAPNADGTYNVTFKHGTYTINLGDAADVTGAADADGDGVWDVTHGTDVTFTPAATGGVVTGVTAAIGGQAVDVTANADGSYTIAGSDITGDITLTFETAEGSWVFFDTNDADKYYVGKNGHKIAVFESAELTDEKYVLGTAEMYYSEKYAGYVAFVGNNETEATLSAKLQKTQGAATEVAYTGDISANGAIDSYDAQLVNNALHYFDGPAEADGVQYGMDDLMKFRCDVNGDKKVDNSDILAIQDIYVGTGA